MACTLTSGFSLDCKNFAGGMTDIVIGVWTDVVATGLAFDVTTTEIEDLPTGLSMYRYEVDDITGTFGDVYSGEENGVGSYAVDISFRLRGITQAKLKEFQLLAQNRVVAFVVPHRTSGYDKKIYCLGLSRGLQLTGGGASQEAGIKGFSGVNFQLAGEQTTPLKLVEPYTSLPFDNAAFGGITITPAFTAAKFL